MHWVMCAKITKQRERRSIGRFVFRESATYNQQECDMECVAVQ